MLCLGNACLCIFRSDTPDDIDSDMRMYEHRGNSMCPVKSFEKYLSKLHPCIDVLWQRPILLPHETTQVWYGTAPIGKNTLAQWMAKISREAGLSKVYTNHCLRATGNKRLHCCDKDTAYIMYAPENSKPPSTGKSHANRQNKIGHSNEENVNSKIEEPNWKPDGGYIYQGPKPSNCVKLSAEPEMVGRLKSWICFQFIFLYRLFGLIV